MRRRGYAPVRAWVEAGFEAREAAVKLLERPRAAAWKVRLLPDFIETTGIAGVTPLQVHRPDSEPAGDPDVDGVVLGQGAPGDGWRGLDKECDGHDSISALRLRSAEPAAMRECACGRLTRRAIRD